MGSCSQKNQLVKIGFVMSVHHVSIVSKRPLILLMRTHVHELFSSICVSRFIWWAPCQRVIACNWCCTWVFVAISPWLSSPKRQQHHCLPLCSTCQVCKSPATRLTRCVRNWSHCANYIFGLSVNQSPIGKIVHDCDLRTGCLFRLCGTDTLGCSNAPLKLKRKCITGFFFPFTSAVKILITWHQSWLLIFWSFLIMWQHRGWTRSLRCSET